MPEMNGNFRRALAELIEPITAPALLRTVNALAVLEYYVGQLAHAFTLAARSFR